MENKLQLVLDIVRTKKASRLTFFNIAFFIIYLIAMFVVISPEILGVNGSDIPLSLKILSSIIFLSGVYYFLILNTWEEVELLGKITISSHSFIVDKASFNKTIPINNIRKIEFDYSGYAAIWSERPRGNGSYIKIDTIDGEEHDYEVRIKTKMDKEKLKEILKK